LRRGLATRLAPRPPPRPRGQEGLTLAGLFSPDDLFLSSAGFVLSWLTRRERRLVPDVQLGLSGSWPAKPLGETPPLTRTRRTDPIPPRSEGPLAPVGAYGQEGQRLGRPEVGSPARGASRASPTFPRTTSRALPVRVHWTLVRLNSVLNTRPPSALRRCSPVGPPATSDISKVSS
jgi:hypothetical protein